MSKSSYSILDREHTCRYLMHMDEVLQQHRYIATCSVYPSGVTTAPLLDSNVCWSHVQNGPIKMISV